MQIKWSYEFEINIFKPSLCDYSDAYSYESSPVVIYSTGINAEKYQAGKCITFKNVLFYLGFNNRNN